MKSQFVSTVAVALCLSAGGAAGQDIDTLRSRIAANLDAIERFEAEAVVSVRTS